MFDNYSNFQRGNIANPSAEKDQFKQWSLGDFVKWAAATGKSLSTADATLQYGLRYTDAIEVKWSHHPAGDQRDWAPPGTGFTLAILICGAFLEEFRLPGSESIEAFRLESRGEYIAWRNQLFEHKWQALVESDFLTIRWWDQNHPRS
jgi:hypothetical protein